MGDGRLITIIIAVYNVAEYLPRCLKSIEIQKSQNFEVVIVDDGSTDESGQICDDWACNKSNIRVYHQSNKGVAETRNFGLEHAYGDYIAFVDPDDWLEGEYTATIQNLIEQSSGDAKVDGIGLNFSVVKKNINNSNIISENKNPYPKQRMTGIEAANLIFSDCSSDFTWQYIFNRKIYMNSNIRFPSLVLYEDAATIYRLLLSSDNIVYTNKSLYNYLEREDSFSHKPTLERTTEYFTLFRSMELFFIEIDRSDLIKNAREYRLSRTFLAYMNLIRLNITKKEKKKYYDKISELIKQNRIWNPVHSSLLIKQLLYYFKLFRPALLIHDFITSK